MPRGQEGHQLVADALWRERRAVLVARVEQHRDRVAAARVRPLGDQLLRDAIQPRLHSDPGEVTRRRQPGRAHHHRAEDGLDPALRGLDGGADLGRDAIGAGAEQRLAHDPEGQAGHRLAHLDFARPAVERRLGDAHDVGREGRQSLLVERGLHDPAVYAPVLALGREDAGPEEERERLVHARPTRVELPLRDEHLADELGRADHEAPHGAEADRRDVAVRAGQLGEQAQRVRPHRERVTEEREGPRRAVRIEPEHRRRGR